MFDYSIRVLLTGASHVGKTSILRRYLKNEYSDVYVPTYGLDMETKEFIFDEDKVQAVFIDTAGQERYKSINRHFLRNINGVVGVYSVVDRESFETVEDWFDDVYDCSDVIDKALIGNKCDVDENESKVSNKEGLFLSKKLNCMFAETSAKTGENIKSTLDDFVKNLYEKMKEKKLSTVNKSIFLKNKEEKKEEKGSSRCCFGGKSKVKKENKENKENEDDKENKENKDNKDDKENKENKEDKDDTVDKINKEINQGLFKENDVNENLEPEKNTEDPKNNENNEEL